DYELRSRGERGCVKPFGDATAGEFVRIADPVWALDRKPQAGVVVGRLSYGDEVAGLHADQSADLPACYLPEPWNVVDPAEREHPGDIATRQVAFQVPIICVCRAGRVQYGTCENGLRENAGCVVDQLGKSVGGVDSQAV